MIFGKSECDATKYENMVVSTDFSEIGDEECDSYPKFKEDSMLDILFNGDIDNILLSYVIFKCESGGEGRERFGKKGKSRWEK